MYKPAIAIATTLTLFAATAVAQTPPMKLRGTIEMLDGLTMIVRARDGRDVSVTLAADAKVIGVRASSVDQIKPGSYVGSAAVTLPDGTLKALEVTVFPPAMAGAGEGHYPWDSAPGSNMTNGTVGDVLVSNGRTLTVRYKGGEQHISVGDGVPVVKLEPADRALLVPGAHVFLVPMPGTGGAMTAAFVTVGEGGVVPPM